jgi:hypothetical protein
MAVGSYVNSTGQKVTLAEVWDGATWAIQRTPGPANAFTSELLAVSCSSPSACIAVGDYNNNVGKGLTLAEEWDGSTWKVEKTANPTGSDRYLDSVSCSAAVACTAVGDYVVGSGASATEVTLAEAWNGTTWSAQKTPNQPAATDGTFLYGVSCSSPVACAAVGYYIDASRLQVPVAAEWDGSAWAVRATPDPAWPDPSVLYAVSCDAPDNCTAVGDSTVNAPGEGRTIGTNTTLAEHWDGRTWAVRKTPTPASGGSLHGVSCSSPSACTAVGSTGAGPALAEHWAGTTWAAQGTPGAVGPEDELDAVSCAPSGSCTAVGYQASFFYQDPALVGSSGPPLALAESWDGTSWAQQVVPDPVGAGASALLGVSCAGPEACTAVGDYFGTSGELVTLAEDWDGTAWAVQGTRVPPGAVASELLGVSCSSVNACTAVGYYTTSAGGEAALAEDWDGTAWAAREVPVPAAAATSGLLGVSCSSVNACTAVGYYTTSAGGEAALAEDWDGTAWAAREVPVPAAAVASELLGVSCSSVNACTAVGYYTTSAGGEASLAEDWDGTAWVAQEVPDPVRTRPGSQPDYRLQGVSCSSPSSCTAVGYYGAGGGLAEAWNGETWAVQGMSAPVSSWSELLGVSCRSSNVCTAVGYYMSPAGTEKTLAEDWDGTAWVAQDLPNPRGSRGISLDGVSCDLTGGCTAVGSGSLEVPLVVQEGP